MIRYTLLIGLFLFLFSCQQKTNNKQVDHFGSLASMIRMQSDTVIFPVSDFVISGDIDSISVSDGFAVQMIDGNRIELMALSNEVHLGIIDLCKDGYCNQVLCKRSTKKEVQFNFDLPDATQVQVVGEMTNWSPQPLKKNDNGTWEKLFYLENGSYQYQIVVDEQWMLDPTNEKTAENGIGGINSVLQVGDGVTVKTPQIVISEQSDYIQLAIDTFDQLYVFWENEMLEVLPDLTVKIPAYADDLERSHIRIWAHVEGALTDLKLPLSKGRIIREPTLLTRKDKATQRMYFILVDRFLNGDTDIDDPLEDPDVHPKANYHGGDLKGIQDKVEEGYFTDLHMNTIWLSPITQNPLHAEVEYPAPHRKYSGYHGYWPISATKVDHRFGDEKSLHHLVGAVHGQDMNIILDYVSNHVHVENPIYKAHPEWASILDLPDGRKNIRIWDEHRLTTWFDLFIPTIDFSISEAVDLMTDSALYMLQKYKIDGFRHDATKHIPYTFWRTLTQKIKQDSLDVYQVGETFGTRELIGNYVGNGLLDGQFDFNLYFDLRTILAKDESSFIDLASSLDQSIHYYGMQSLMGNISGNHDIPRFISYAGKGLSFQEDEKKAGWERDIQVLDTLGYKRLALLMAVNFTIPGIPVVYYGDEIGMPGAGDPDNRRPMQFDSLNEQQIELKETIANLSKLRSEHMALMYGDMQIKVRENDVLVYCRRYIDQEMIIILNKSNETKQIEWDEYSYSIDPYSFKIIDNTTK